MKDSITQILREAGRPLSPEEICTHFRAEQADEVYAALNEMADDGQIMITRRRKAALPAQLGLTYGRIQGNARGFGFFIPADGGSDMFIAAEAMNGAMHGDMVWARRTETAKKDQNDRAEVAVIAHRQSERLTGVFEKDNEYGGYVVPDDTRICVDVLIPAGSVNGAEHGDKVVAEIVQYPDARRPMLGRITEVLGKAGAKGMDVLSIIRRLDLPDEFSKAALEQAKQLAKAPAEAEISGRSDYRGLLTITIDGADAKDLDDAVSLQKNARGNYLLGVHIADVANYVQEGGAIDRDAYRRGTSVYFPDRVLPMLPKELSNGVCSLNPNEDKLTLSCVMELTPEGTVINHTISESVIRSDHRMTYSDVNAIFAGDEVLRGKYSDILPMLEDMRALMMLLQAKRTKRGSIDFDLAEAKITLDENGRAADVQVCQRGEANKMIEEFMLAANETVAHHAVDKEIPLMFRVHEPPDTERMKELNVFLGTLGYGIKNLDMLRPSAVQRVLEKAKGTPEETVVSRVTLRAMTKAKYSPDCTGHFGLAASCYCHFTSPIRRYPDLTVHRVMKDMIHNRLDKKRIAYWTNMLAEASVHCSSREIAAVEAERAADDLKKCEYMQDHLGLEETGVISGVAQYGFFVQLPNTVEGLVRAGSMMDDYYVCDEKNYRLVGRSNGRQYRLGDEVRVKAVAANTETGNVDFELCREAVASKQGAKRTAYAKKTAEPQSTRAKKNDKIIVHAKGGGRGGHKKRSVQGRRKPKGTA